MLVRGITTLALAITLVPAPAGAKTAVTQACTDVAAPVRTANLKQTNGNRVYGTIQLRRDTCHQFYAYLKLNDPASSGTRATAVLGYWRDAPTQPGLTCNSRGGNGYILPGQTSCHTGKISWVLVDAFIATGHLDYQADGDIWRAVAVGQTPRAPGRI